MIRTVCAILLMLACFSVKAQLMTGQVVDEKTGTPVADATVLNTFTGQQLTIDTSGRFSMPAHAGELVTFRRLGYKVARIRIPQGAMPPYFKVTLIAGAFELDNVNVRDRKRDFRQDSAHNHELFKEALEFPELSGLDVIRHPFSALSKTNRQKWAFQKEYAEFEEMKYVDYAFNAKLITTLTGLQGDSLNHYMTRYRPAYEQVRAWKEYELLRYIRASAERFRSQHGRGFQRVVVPEQGD